MSNIKLSIPNDDHVALRAMAKALEEIAVARGAPPVTNYIGEMSYKLNIDTAHATAALERLREHYSEVDTTSQQVESLHVSAQHLFKPEDYVSMYNPTTDVYRLAKSSAEIDECFDEGYEQHTREQYEAWKRRPSEQYDDEHAPLSTDSTGISWDERIHASSKALNSDGTWRVRRKPKDMDEAEWADYVEMIKADIEYPVECGGQEPPVAAEGDNFHVDAGEVTEQEVAGIPPLPVPPLPVPPGGSGTQVQSTPHKLVGAGDDLTSGAGITPQTLNTQAFGYGGGGAVTMTFPQVMAYLTERHGRISNAQVEQIIASMGLKSIMDLNTQSEHTGPFIARVKALLGE